MSSSKPLRIGIVQASPRLGSSARIASLIVDTLERQGVEAPVLNLKDLDICPCIACDICQETGDCFMTDGEDRFVEFLLDADAVILITPIYFAGPPAHLKAALDRLQYLWARRYCLDVNPRGSRRPFCLIAIGSGGDPFGFEPLVTIVSSAMRMTDLELCKTVPLIGYREVGTAISDAQFEQEAVQAALDLAYTVEKKDRNL